MNVRDLIEALEDLDPETEVVLAHQPRFPLQFTLAGVVSTEQLAEAGCQHGYLSDCPDGCSDTDWQDSAPRVYLVEGDRPDDTPYAPSALWSLAS